MTQPVETAKLPWFLSSPSARLISQNPDRITWELRVFTPMMAQTILAGMSERQRNVRDSNVATLTKEMREGRWCDLGEPFATLDSFGTVINGQHRARALVAANVQLSNVTVVQVMCDTAATCIDTGRTRNVGDMRRMTGERTVHGSVSAAIVLEACDFVPARATAMGVHERYIIGTQCEYLDELVKLQNVGRRLSVAQGPLAAALRCMRGTTDRTKPYDFFAAAFQNEYVIGGVLCLPAKALANYLIKHGKHGHHGARGSHTEEAAASITAWNMYRRRVNSERLRVPEDMPAALS